MGRQHDSPCQLDHSADFIFRDSDYKWISSPYEFHPSSNKQIDSQWFNISWIFLGNQSWNMDSLFKACINLHIFFFHAAEL